MMTEIIVYHPLFSHGETVTTPRELELLVCSSKYAYQINKLWHSSMPLMPSYKVCKPCFIGIANNVVYASALWSLPIAANRLKNGSLCLELRRFAIADYAPRNTASYLLSRMEKYIKHIRPDIIKLISYQDTEFHNGAIYKASNWIAANEGVFVSWSNHTKRPGHIEQSTAPKIRWEKILRKEPPLFTLDNATEKAEQLRLFSEAPES